MGGKWIAVALGLACFGISYAVHQRPPARAAGGDKAAAKKLTPLYFGVSACRKCHNEAQPVPDKDALLYRGIEMRIWNEHDKHKDATRVLKGERSQQMAKRLGWDVAADRRCLSCHGVVVANEKEIDDDSFQPAQREESGVSCVVCHGAYQEWVNNHALVIGGGWKKLTRAEKERDHGLRDLWDPATRAALCCSCHVGSVAQGKVITHEMYAAGHPPLPGIEIETFSEAMPRHWETLGEKVRKRPQHKEFYKRVHGFDAERDEIEPARGLTISALVAMRTSMQLLHDTAQRDIAAPNAKEPAWPELAAFDCYACHHDLKSDGWRQRRPTAGRPGRPTMRAWSVVLADVSVKHLARHQGTALAEEFQLKLKDLHDVFAQTPFGSAPLVADKAGALVKQTDELVRALQASRFDRAASLELLRSLLTRRDKEVLDFDSARQIAWGLKTLLPALEPDAPGRAEVKTALELLNRQLMLELPKGQVRIAEDYLLQVLKCISAYDSTEFHKTMHKLAAALLKTSPDEPRP